MEGPIRVAQVLNRMDSGGIEAVVMNYYRHIDRGRVQFDFYFAEGSALPQRGELERLGAGVYPIPPYSRPLAYHRALYRAFKERRYRVVHAHLSTMSVFALFAAWRAGVPVRICHNHSTAHWGEGAKTLLKYLLRPFNKLFATHYFACGERAGRWMFGSRAFEKGEVHVMPNAIDAERFAFDPAARARLRQELGIPRGAFVVGHVGRFMYQKNHAFLLRVFQQLLEQRQDAWLLLVGEGELLEQIRAQAQRLGLADRVVFTGARADVDKLYSAMDAFCLPSFYEGLPVVALEAQANGLLCVFSDRMTREVLLSCGAVRLPLKAPRRWASALREAERLSPAQAAAMFDVRAQAERLAADYLMYIQGAAGTRRETADA